MALIFEKLKAENKEMISQMAEFAGNIFFEYYDSYLPAGQAEYMKNKFLSEEAIAEKISEAHTPKVNFEFVEDEKTKEKIGFVCYWIQKDENEKNECYLDKYYLASSFRGKGFGKLIMNHLKTFCAENQLGQISLNVNKYNKTVKIYEKLGFKNVRSEVNDIGSGYVMDDFVMRLFVQEA